MSFRVLFVCTGNICRSPSAERVLRARLDPRAPVTVASAGTGALVGRGIDGPTAVALRALGADPDGHRAQLLTPALLADADLILTAETAHRSAIVQADPLLFRRAFTMAEFGRLGAALPPREADGARPADPDALRARVVEVAAQRGEVDAPEPGADEIGDPFGANADVAAAVAGRVARVVDAVVDTLGLRPARA